MANPYLIHIDGADGIGIIDGEATLEPDPATAGLPFKPDAGADVTILASSDGTNALIQGGDDTGGVTLSSLDGTQQITAYDGGALVGSAFGKLGFFGTAPVEQPAAPVLLSDVIGALQALGLVAS